MDDSMNKITKIPALIIHAKAVFVKLLVEKVLFYLDPEKMLSDDLLIYEYLECATALWDI